MSCSVRPEPAAASTTSTANYSFNYTPDFVVKMAFEPGWGHWEVFGIDRNFRDRIYPCATVSATCTVPTTATPTNSTATGAGIGGGFRAPLAGKYVDHRPEGIVGPGRRPLRLFDHRRRYPAPRCSHLSHPRILRA